MAASTKGVEQTVAALGRMTVPQLREKYLELFGEPTRSGNRDFLFKRLAWRVEAVERRVEHFTTCGALVVLGPMDDIAKDLVNTWEAWGRFCRTRLGVEPETMMRAWQFPLEEFQETLKYYEKSKPDPEKVREYTGYICKHWDRRFRRTPGSEYVIYTDEDEGGGGDGE